MTVQCPYLKKMEQQPRLFEYDQIPDLSVELRHVLSLF